MNMSEGDDPQKREAEANAAFARSMATAIKRRVGSDATVREYCVGNVELILRYKGESDSEVVISYNDDQETTYHISPTGISKTGSFAEGCKVATPPAVVPREKALVAHLARYPLNRRVQLALCPYAMWSS
jgi:hypothetical protein